MPELPEVQSTLLSIYPYLIRKKILFSVVRNSNLRLPISREIYEIKNYIIVDLFRKGKYLIIHLNYGYIIIHLGMSGNLCILPNNQSNIFNNNDHIDLFISNNKILRYNDVRRFGLFVWVNNFSTFKFISNLGPDPFSSKFSEMYFFSILRQKKTFIKNCLMNQSIISGLGNIYSNECLFHSGILPTRISNTLSFYEVKKLVFIIKLVLKSSIKLGGTTIKNFICTNRIFGLFYRNLYVYNRKNKQCYLCNNLIMSIIQNKRKSFFCDFCQY
ncbi:bifunctional DNA-formamidopyrimidine glycosylase/DNA-(apurinic or apyrimidinic site) lyase [Buchnera aphidicola (Neophyllaphis podocarpi)]|uniref:bifunctional DNA-formamidopyrimidine glycosylase/DNA-(apurinic or apyrimidinic site) lyase n=1 Tax=Buchnera aphidicola TaxID=9 RepID=UPI0031B84823